MKVLNEKDINPGDSVSEVGEQSKTVSASSARDLIDQMGDGVKSDDALANAVVDAFNEADEIERKEAEAKAEAERVEAENISIDVQAHVGQDPLLQSASGSGEDAESVGLTQAHKDAFVDALLENKRYVEKFSLFGGKVSVTLRSRTLEETDSIEAYLRKQVVSGAVSTSNDYSNLVRKVLLTAQVQEMNGTVYEELRKPMREVETENGKTPVGWEPQLAVWGAKPNAVAVAVTRCLTEFEARYWFMVDKAKDTNFWSRGESTAQ